MKPSVNTKKCPAQEKVCTVIPACPTGAVRYEPDAKAPLGGRIVIENALCNECGLCVSVCCGQAVVVDEGIAQERWSH
jgi:ferredoxin